MEKSCVLLYKTFFLDNKLKAIFSEGTTNCPSVLGLDYSVFECKLFVMMCTSNSYLLKRKEKILF